VLALLYIYVYTPLAEQESALSAQLAEKTRKLAEAKALARKLPYLKRRCALLKQQLAIAERMLPSKEEVPALLREITLIGNRTEIEFLRFSPRESEVKMYYEEIPIDVTVTGKYHAIGAFLQQIGALHRIIIPSVREITSEEAEEEAAQGQIVAHLKIKTFCFKE
jgi:type IV pilus assembly protein PilO